MRAAIGASLIAMGSLAPCRAQKPAFPEAQGGGAASLGGRGGVVKEVTSLEDSGAGSFRACVEAKGPRTCIFRVAGLITQHSDVTVNNPFLTIAGQTAPGEIILGGPGNKGFTLRVSTHDVVIRYITISPDDLETPSGPSTGTVGFAVINGNNYNIILDHVSSRWAGNKLWITGSNYVGPNRSITTSWSLFYEPHAGHPVGPGTACLLYTSLFGAKAARARAQFVAGDAAHLGFGRCGDDLGKHQADMVTFWLDGGGYRCCPDRSRETLLPCARLQFRRGGAGGSNAGAIENAS